MKSTHEPHNFHVLDFSIIHKRNNNHIKKNETSGVHDYIDLLSARVSFQIKQMIEK